MLKGAYIAGTLTDWLPFSSSFIAVPVRCLVSPAVQAAECWRNIAYNRRILLDPRYQLPWGSAHYVDAVQRRFLAERAKDLAERVRARRIVDGHGDLRPEHICLGDPVRIIDCLEFNARLRMVDPFDEIAFLCLECQRLGVALGGRIFAPSHHACAP